MKHEIIEIVRGTKDRDKFMIKALNVDLVDDMIGELEELNLEKPLYVEPQFTKPKPFRHFWHKEAGPMVRNAHPEAYKDFTMEKTPKVFETINKLMSNAYRVNEDVLAVYQQSKQDPVFTFEGKDLDEKQLESKTKEMDITLRMAEAIGDRTYWEYLFYDWRGRIYSAVSYLKHDGSKLAKSLIKLDKKTPLGTGGLLLPFSACCKLLWV